MPLAIIHQGFYRQLAVFGFLLGFSMLSVGVSAVWWWLIRWLCVRHYHHRLRPVCGTLVCFNRLSFTDSAWHHLFTVLGVFWDLNAITDDTLREGLIALNPATLIDAYRQVLVLGVAPDMTRLLRVLLEATVLLIAAVFAISDYSSDCPAGDQSMTALLTLHQVSMHFRSKEGQRHTVLMASIFL